MTNGVQADVEITLGYRPDVAKGEVTGSVTGVGVNIGPGASPSWSSSMSTLVRRWAWTSRPRELPAPFAIPFAISDLKAGGAYVVQAELTSGSTRFGRTPRASR